MSDLEQLRAIDRRRAAAWTAAHAGHDIATQRRNRSDGTRQRWCRTCRRAREYDMDPVVVQRALAGDRPGRLTIAERRDAVAQLRPRMSGARIAQQLGVTDRTVWRDIAANRTTED